MGKPQINNCSEEDSFTSSKLSRVQNLRSVRGRRKLIKDEDYIPSSDSSDSEEDRKYPKKIHSGSLHEDLRSILKDLKNGKFHGVPDLKFSITRKQRLLLEQQMRMCVQLTTQAYLMSFAPGLYDKLMLCAKEHLQKMVSLASLQTNAGKKSCFDSVNLSDAMAIIYHFEKRSTAEMDDVFRDAKRVLCESKVFMYLDLCPETHFIMPDSPKSEPKLKFCRAEDNLIALGLEKYNNFRSMAKIQQNFLPCRTAKAIRERAKTEFSSRKNPIQHFREVGELPKFPVRIRPFNEKDIKAPVEYDTDNLPKWMEPFVDIFERNGPFPYFLDSYVGICVQNNFDVSNKPLCNDLKLEEDLKPTDSKKNLNVPMSNRKSNFKTKSFAINHEIDLCQEFCDPILVNTNFSEFTHDLDLDISMSGGIKLSALKKPKAKPTFMPYNRNELFSKREKIISNPSPRLENSIKQETDIELDNLQKNENLSCDPVLQQQVKISTSSQGFSFNQVSVTSHFKNKPCLTHPENELSSVKTYSKLITVKHKNESDAILKNINPGNICGVQKSLNNITCGTESFPAKKIKEEPL